MTPTNPPQYSIEEILTKLWCAVDIEDVTKGLIDVGAIDDAVQAINAYTTNKIIDALEELLLQFRRLPMPESQRDVIVTEFSKALNHRKER